MVEPVALSDQSETSTYSQISPPLTGSAGTCERERERESFESPRLRYGLSTVVKVDRSSELKVCHFYNSLGVLV